MYNAIQHPYNKKNQKLDTKKAALSHFLNIHVFLTVELPIGRLGLNCFSKTPKVVFNIESIIKKP